MKLMRDSLIMIYTDYCNNYLSVELFAEHNGLTYIEGERLIALAREVASHSHPDA